MEKWEQQLDQEVNGNLPKVVEQQIEETLNTLPNKKASRKKWMYSVAAAVVATGIVVSSSSVSTTIADSLQSVPVIGSVMEKVGGLGEKNGQQKGLTVTAGEEVDIGDQTIIFTETLYDGNSIYISYLNTSTDLNKQVLSGVPTVMIDGEPLRNYGIGAGGQKLKEGVYGETMSIRTSEELPDEFLLTLGGETNGSQWQVDLPVEKKGAETVIPLNESFSNEDNHLRYSTLSFTSTSTRVQFQLITPEDSKLIQNGQHFDIQVEDGNGRVLRGIGASSRSALLHDGTVQGQYTFDLEPYGEDLPESITIKPYLMKIPLENEDVEPVVFTTKKWKGEPITLSQGEMGNLTVQSVERIEGDVTITYSVDGEDEAMQSSTFWIEDSENNMYKENRVERRVEGNTFKQTFYDFPAEEDIYLHSTEMDSHHYISNFEVTIDIQ
ncbi:DUF4179 domain-containing protein [Pontibacillus salipaludis]|uniref:DUF4179 domain-containing protein n=1 Tax=Pontibacillus salipaludis TaxID=1697394 RepID=A0ABQ1QF10_9BACI|nr:DUF4179 domain-containing protein [Pontibacillus salipaludis]GGD24532.1 hypothetical protein GCM10011389_35440 [Pontibacillus salipaludis]